MAAPKDSRIQIDLKLLQDKNLERLEKFSQQFDKSVDKLADIFKSHADRIETAMASGGGGGLVGLSANASTPQTAHTQIQQAAPTAALSARQQEMASSPFMKGLIRLGSTPNSFRQVFGFLSEISDSAIAADPSLYREPRSGKPEGPGRAAQFTAKHFGPNAPLDAGKISEMMFVGQAGASGLRNMLGAFRSLAVQGAYQGQEAGLSRKGILGTPLFSPAWNYGIGQKWDIFKRTWGGLNPNFTPGQAAAVKEAIRNYGWSTDSDVSGSLFNEMQRLSEARSMSPDQYMALADPLVRWGGGSVDQLNDAVNSIEKAAKSAHIPLSQLAASIGQIAQQALQATGMDPTAATRALTAISGGTGINPEVLGNRFTYPNLVMGAALTGQQPWRVLSGTGSKTTTALLAMPELVVKNVIGEDPRRLAQTLKHSPNDPHANAKMNALYMLYSQNPELFGNINPRAWLNMLSQGVNPSKRLQALEDIQTAHPGGLNRIIAEFGGKESKWLQHDLVKNMGKDFEGRRSAIEAQMLKYSDQARKKAAKQTVDLILSPQAAKLLRFMKTDKPHTNQSESGWHKAIQIGTDVAETAALIPISPAAAIQHALSFIP